MTVNALTSGFSRIFTFPSKKNVFLERCLSVSVCVCMDVAVSDNRTVERILFNFVIYELVPYISVLDEYRAIYITVQAVGKRVFWFSDNYGKTSRLYCM